MKTNKMKNIFLHLAIVLSMVFSTSTLYAMPSCGDPGYAPPSNDDCSSAYMLTEGVEDCGFTTECSSNEVGECITNYGGGADNTAIWFRFQATSPEMVFNLMVDDNLPEDTHIRLYGPYPPGGGCMPGCADAIVDELMAGDPGKYSLLEGLSTTAGNNEYLIQIQRLETDAEEGGSFCAGIYEPASNNSPGSPLSINECGTAFNGSTAGGIYAAGEGPARADYTGDGLDDVPYVTNNDSWFSFCPSTTGDYQVEFNNVSCFFDGIFAGGGSQFSVLTGPPDASTLTNVFNGTNPIPSGSSETTPTFTVNAGECAYLYVDGFAGDGCEYSYEVNLMSGGACVLLPVELVSFKVLNRSGFNEILWTSATEKNSDFFTLYHSNDGDNWREIAEIKGAGNSTSEIKYSYKHHGFSNKINYYRLSQTDFDGTTQFFNIVSVDNRGNTKIIKTVNLMGQVVDENYRGIVIDIYDDGSRQKRMQN